MAKWSQFEKPNYVFWSGNSHFCVSCGGITHFIVHGIHAFVCDSHCLKMELERIIERVGLKDYVEIKKELGDA